MYRLFLLKTSKDGGKNVTISLPSRESRPNTEKRFGTVLTRNINIKFLFQTDIYTGKTRCFSLYSSPITISSNPHHRESHVQKRGSRLPHRFPPGNINTVRKNRLQNTVAAYYLPVEPKPPEPLSDPQSSEQTEI